MQKFHHVPGHGGQSVSVYDGDETLTKTASKLSINKKKAETKFRHSIDDGHILRNQHDHLLARRMRQQSLMSGELSTFEELLDQSPFVMISTQKKILTEVSNIGTSGYEITTPTGQRIGFLISEAEPTWLDKLCCASHADENDQFSYRISAPNGKELLCIYGLDEDVATDETVQMTRLKIPIGTINYSYLGTSVMYDSLSKATSFAGRDGSFMIPTSVLAPSGDLLYIFRSSSNFDDLDHTELLTADGYATTVSEIIKEKVILKPNEATPRRSNIPKTKVFTVHFNIEMSPEEKSLVLTIAVSVFNRWLRKKKPKKKSCRS